MIINLYMRYFNIIYTNDLYAGKAPTVSAVRPRLKYEYKYYPPLQTFPTSFQVATIH